MEVILDTNFIISCIKKKIDFIDVLEEQGFKVLLPREVQQEMKDLRLKVSSEDRRAIDVAFDIFSSRKIRKISLGNVPVDEGLITKGKQGAYIASLDAAIKRAVPNKVVISAAQQQISIERS